MPLLTAPTGHIFGAARAEADALLSRAFIETPAYRALTETTDYTFVVGRRGTGKSALFRKMKEYFAAAPRTILIADVPQEHHMIELQTLLMKSVGPDYRLLRAVSRLVWRTHLLVDVFLQLCQHFRFFRIPSHPILHAYREAHKAFVDTPGSARPVALLRAAIDGAAHGVELAPRLASLTDCDRLQQLVTEGLEALGERAVVLYDGLDEGWVPDVPATAVLGGLAMASTDLIDRQTGVGPLLFVRDNMFRALAQLDSDFTRHIEGHTLRLHWDDTSFVPPPVCWTPR